MASFPLDPTQLIHQHARHVGNGIGDVDRQRDDVTQFLTNLIQGFSLEKAPHPNGLLTIVCDQGKNACGYFRNESFRRIQGKDEFCFLLTHWEGAVLNIAHITVQYLNDPKTGLIIGEIRAMLYTNPPDPKARGCVAETEFIEA